MDEERSSLIRQLEARLEREHTERCDNNTCDINQAYEEGLTLWAARLFDGSGAASEKFTDLYAEINPTEAELDAECDKLCAVPHVQCPECGSIVYRPERYTSCGNCLEKNVGVVETFWGSVNPIDGELYD